MLLRRFTGETQALTGGPTGSFVYDYNYATDDGNLTRHTRPDGSHLDYAWNARNLLAGITSDAPPPVATYSYNAQNQITSTIIENGLFTATRSYDAAGRLTGVSNGALDSTGYTLSPDGRRTGITRNGDAETYGYDNARQVTSGNYGGLSTTQSWNYDPAGNRQNATTNGVTTNYLADSVNAYTSISGGGFQPPNPTSDPNGNATTWNVRLLLSPGLLSSVFAWNIHNELTGATNSSGDTATYAYDAFGRRVKRVESIGGTTTTTWFFYNGWNVELEHNGTAYTRRHTWGLDLSNSLQGAGGVGGLVMVEHLPPLPLGTEPLGEIPEGSKGGGEGASGMAEAYFPTFDGNGNITAWVDATGTVTARQRYDAYGNILSQTGIAPSNYAFSTKPKERVTGLYYYGYRYYDPVVGRWINRDPMEEGGGLNLYGFVGNDAANRFDLLGLDFIAVGSRRLDNFFGQIAGGEGKPANHASLEYFEENNAGRYSEGDTFEGEPEGAQRSQTVELLQFPNENSPVGYGWAEMVWRDMPGGKNGMKHRVKEISRVGISGISFAKGRASRFVVVKKCAKRKDWATVETNATAYPYAEMATTLRSGGLLERWPDSKYLLPPGNNSNTFVREMIRQAKLKMPHMMNTWEHPGAEEPSPVRDRRRRPNYDPK